jgi:hypothetical protein
MMADKAISGRNLARLILPHAYQRIR